MLIIRRLEIIANLFLEKYLNIRRNDKMKQWVKKHMILSWVIASILYAFIIHCLFSYYPSNTWLIAKWTAGEILTYASTVSLGLLAVWQNKKFQEENDIAQDRLESIIKYSNELSIIGKICEYEVDNIHRLRKSLDDFSQICDPQNICSHYISKTSQNLEVLSTMAMLEQKLIYCFFQLGRELRIDLELKQNDETPVKKTFCAYYRMGKEFINKLKTEPLENCEQDIIALSKARDAFCEEGEKYLVEQEKKLNKLLYEDLSVDEIKSLYKRI